MELPINPLLLRYLRQSVRTRSVFLFFYLGAILFMAVLSFPLWEPYLKEISKWDFPGWQSFSEGTYFQAPLGRKLFKIYYFFCNLFILLIIPIYVGYTILQEKILHQDELVKLTSLSPAQTVRGILGFGMVVIFLWMMILFPFMFYASLQGGMNFFVFSLSLLFSFFSSFFLLLSFLIVAGIFNRTQDGLGNWGFLFVLIPAAMVWRFSVVVVELLGSLRQNLYTPDFWWFFLLLFIIYSSWIGVIYRLAVSIHQEKESNRSTSLRLSMVVQTLVVSLVAVMSYFKKYFLWDPRSLWGKLILVDGIFFFYLLSWGMWAFILSLEEEKVTTRQREEFLSLPRMRWMAFVLLPGPSRGFLFISLGLAWTALFLPLCHFPFLRWFLPLWGGFLLGQIFLPGEIYRRYCAAKGKKYSAPWCWKIVLAWNILWFFSTLVIGQILDRQGFSGTENFAAFLNPYWAFRLEWGEAFRFSSLCWMVLAFLIHWRGIKESLWRAWDLVL